MQTYIMSPDSLGLLMQPTLRLHFMTAISGFNSYTVRHDDGEIRRLQSELSSEFAYYILVRGNKILC
jgi:hypothetical protein